MTPETKSKLKSRLARVEGQVRGLSQMVDQDRYCIDVVTQVRAARAALRKIEQQVLADHIGSCVEAAIVSGDPKEQRTKVSELLELLGQKDR